MIINNHKPSAGRRAAIRDLRGKSLTLPLKGG